MFGSRQWPVALVRPLKIAFKCRLAAAFVAALPLLSAWPAQAAESVPLPFVQGEAAMIIQGYNGGTHQGASHYGLGLVLAGSQTSGATVLSPLDGTIAFAFEPGDRTGCVSVLRRDGQFSVMLCHVILDRPYRRGERIARGQPLGVVGAAGQVGNNGTPPRPCGVASTRTKQ